MNNRVKNIEAPCKVSFYFFQQFWQFDKQSRKLYRKIFRSNEINEKKIYEDIRESVGFLPATTEF